MKKVSALFLAMLMCMALAVPALATSGDSISSGGSGTVTYTATVQEPTIDVTVPSLSQAVVLNPYKISVTAEASTVSGGSIATALTSASSNPILASKLYLHNKSTVPLKMTLTLKGTAGSTVTFSATPLTGTTEKNKKVFIYAEVGTTVTTEPSAALAAPSAYSSTNTKQGVFKAGEVKMTEVATIPVASDVDTGNWTPIDLGGDCTTSPTSPWTGSDTVQISMVFSFQAADTTVS